VGLLATGLPIIVFLFFDHCNTPFDADPSGCSPLLSIPMPPPAFGFAFSGSRLRAAAAVAFPSFDRGFCSDHADWLLAERSFRMSLISACVKEILSCLAGQFGGLASARCRFSGVIWHVPGYLPRVACSNGGSGTLFRLNPLQCMRAGVCHATVDVAMILGPNLPLP